MISYKKKVFVKLFDDDLKSLFRDLILEDCTFDNCGLSLNVEVETRSVVRNLIARNCTVINCSVGPAVFESVSIETLKTNDLLILWGAVFKEVKLTGRVGKLKINRKADTTSDRSLLESFERANQAFYANVNWALDISEAIFQEFVLEGVPSDLIVRDPSSQAIVQREMALRTDWRSKVSSFNSYWPFVIDMFLDSGDPGCVLVAPKGKPKKQLDKLLDGLKELRDLGVAEPN